MAGAVNIRFGATTGDFTTALTQMRSSVTQFSAQTKFSFGGLGDLAKPTITGLGDLNRKLAATRIEIANLAASGSIIPPGLLTSLRNLQGLSESVKSTIARPVSTSAFESLNTRLSETRSQMQNLLAVGKSVPDELTREYRELEAEVRRVNTALNPAPSLSGFGQLNQRLADTRGKMQDILAVGGKVPKELTREFQGLKTQVDSINGSFGKAPSQLGGVLSLAGGYLSLSAALSAVKTGLTIASDFQRMDVALKAVSSSSADFARTQSFLLNTADQYGLSIEALSKSFAGFKANTNDTILKGAEAERIFLSVAKASAALQLSTEDTTGTLRAFGQMLSKGTVQSEELKGQVGERLYNAFGLAAKAMGVTTKELNKMLEQGQVLAVDLLPKLATELDKSFGVSAINNINTMAGGFTRATDQAKLFIAEISNASGVSDTFAGITNGIANTIRGMREAINSREWSVFTKGLLSAATKTVTFGLAPGDPTNRLGQLSENARLKNQFGQMSTSERDARIGVLRDTITRLEKQLAERKDSVVGGGKDQIKSDLKNAQDLLRQLRGLNITLTGNELMTNRNKPLTPTVKIKPLFDIAAARKEYSDLEQKIQSEAGGGARVSQKERDRYKELAAQIERATAATERHKNAHKSVAEATVYLSTNERILKQLVSRYNELGSKAPASLRANVGAFQELVAAEKSALKGAVDLGDKLREIGLQGKTRDALQGLIAPLTQLPGLAGRLGDVTGFGSLGYYQEQIAKIETQVQSLSLKNLAVSPGTLQSLTTYIGQVDKANQALAAARRVAEDNRIAALPQIDVGGLAGKMMSSLSNALRLADISKTLGLDKLVATLKLNVVFDTAKKVVNAIPGFGDVLKIYNDSAATLESRTAQLDQSLTSSVQNAATGLAVSFGELVGGLATGTARLSDLPKALGGVLADLAKSMGQALIGFGTASIAAKGLIKNPATAIAAGIALIALSSGLQASLQKKSATAFQNGGLVYGPVLGLVGEGPGTNRRNPEVITPLDKLRGMIRDTVEPVVLIAEARLSGSDIVTAYRRATAAERSFI